MDNTHSRSTLAVFYAALLMFSKAGNAVLDRKFSWALILGFTAVGAGLPTANLHAQQWETQSTLKYPSVREMRVNPANDQIVVEDVQTFYTSIDSGYSWQSWGLLNGEKLNSTTTLFDFEGDTLFILRSDAIDKTIEVYSSTDAGQNWQMRGSSSLAVSFGSYPKSFLVDQNTVYVGYIDTLLRSTNYGDTYQKEGSTYGGNGLSLDGPMFFFDGTLHMRRQIGGIYRRSGTGTWGLLDTLSGGSIAYRGQAHQVQNGFLYYYTRSPNGIARLEAGTNEWENSPLDVGILNFDTYDFLVDDITIFASSRQGMAYSQDNGASFSKLDTHGLPQTGAQVDHYSGMVRAGDYYVFGGNWGILRAHVDTLMFSSQNRGFDTMSVAVSHVYPLGGNQFIQDDAAGVFTGDPRGEMTYTGSNFEDSRSQFLDRFKDRYVLGTSRGMYDSKNGIDWENNYTSPDATSFTNILSYSINGNRMVVSDNGFLRSSYDLETWTDISLGVPGGNTDVLLWDDRIYVTKRYNFTGTDSDGVYVADTTGLKLTRLYESGEAQLFTDGNKLFLLERSKLLRNEGPTDSSWQELSIGNDENVSDFIAYENLIWVATSSGPYYSSDGGDNWTLYDNGLAFTSTFGGPSKWAAVERDTLYGHTNNTISSLDLTSLAVRVEDVASAAALSVYPNPAREVLYVSGPHEVLAIYDMGGRRLMQGPYQHQIPVGHLKAGVYLLRTSAGEALRFIKE